MLIFFMIPLFIVSVLTMLISIPYISELRERHPELWGTLKKPYLVEFLLFSIPFATPLGAFLVFGDYKKQFPESDRLFRKSIILQLLLIVQTTLFILFTVLFFIER